MRNEELLSANYRAAYIINASNGSAARRYIGARQYSYRDIEKHLIPIYIDHTVKAMSGYTRNANESLTRHLKTNAKASQLQCKNTRNYRFYCHWHFQ